MKSNLEKMISGEVYKQDENLLQIRLNMRDYLFEFNNTHPKKIERRKELLKKIFKKTGENFFIEQPFHCDYGFNITIGENFFANNNTTLLDVCSITIGDDCLFAPNVGIYTAGHAIDPDLRVKEKAEYGAPVVIGNNVWIGANASILPGVTIGNNVVIGAGSVVTKDIPGNVVALGNPCRVLRKVDKKDKEYYYKERKYPKEWLDF